MSPTTTTFSSPSAASSTATCTTAAPGKYGYVPSDSCNSNYNFNPSFDGNMAFAILFGLTTLTHLVQAIIYKKRYCWVIIMGGIWETAAFALKTYGAHNQQQQTMAVLGTLLFLLAPLWINAFAYMTVARMVYFTLPEKKIWGVRAIRLTVIFVWLDVVCFLIQGGGGSLLSNNGNAHLISIGQKVYMAGIGIQMGFVIIFGTMTANFYQKLISLRGRSVGPIRFLIWAMFVVLTLVTMRIIYRLVEFGPGVSSNNKILSNEAYPFGLDASPMLIALVLVNVVHPGFFLKGPDSDFPKITRSDKKQMKRQAKAEKRHQKAAKEARKNGSYQLEEGRLSQGENSDDSSHGMVSRGMAV
ncbi:hypothetical protein G7046_g10086 [Stylonectria norvegica]|nr:hypothetical protein G7046_g10086 [Stylonectria norvegica]